MNGNPFYLKVYSASIRQAILDARILHPNITLQQSFSVTVKEISYKKGDLVLVGIGELVLSYIFGEIIFCLLKEHDAYLIVNHRLGQFNSILSIFELEDVDEKIVCIPVSNLLCHSSLSLNSSFGVEYVKLKYSVCRPLP